jgi:hypothetical protein
MDDLKNTNTAKLMNTPSLVLIISFIGAFAKGGRSYSGYSSRCKERGVAITHKSDNRGLETNRSSTKSRIDPRLTQSPTASKLKNRCFLLFHGGNVEGD